MASVGRTVHSIVRMSGYTCIAALLSAQAALAQVAYTEFDPPVVRSDRTEPVRFLAMVGGAWTRIALERNGVELVMHDDGTAGDVTPGDGIYTLMLPAAELTANLQPDDVFRPFIGFLNLYQQETRVFRGNIFASVSTAEIPPVPVTQIATDAQRSPYVYNVVDTGYATGLSPGLTRITRPFYQHFPDDFDFINVVSTVSRFANRYHINIKNEVHGIGLSLFDVTSTYGSGGRLQGISIFPISGFFDGASPGYQHELAHQWINFLPVPPLDSAIAHWPISSLASGIMGFSIPPSGEGGNYPCFLIPESGGVRLVPRTETPVFKDLDLYLMGLVPANEVQEHIVFADQALARTLPCDGVFIGPTIKVGIDDIVSAVGPRVPDWTTAPRQFKIATIVVSKDRLLNADEMAFFDFFARRAEAATEIPYTEGFQKGTARPFWLSTGGRASLDASLTTSSSPTLTLDKASLRFGAVTTGAAFVSQSAPQVVRLTQSGAGAVTWKATSSQPWLQVSPASGSGSSDLVVSVVATGGLPIGNAVVGTITFVAAGANAPGPLAVSLNLIPNGRSAFPVGVVDTPVDHSTGVTGAVPFTGWALDDVGVDRVTVCRAAVAGEVAPVDPNCGGAAQIFVGTAVFIDGARPDVAAAYPAAPANTHAGWGFMVLTNGLPGQGNGAYLFFVHAQDRDGHTTLLGTRTMSCANASATRPFGTIDTPTQGGVASGAAYVNFGWALTPAPKQIPLDGSTITVWVDGLPLGTVEYNHERPDIETSFPGYANTVGSNGAVGFRVIDTTGLTNGLHTIAWTVIDDEGAGQGIGSRFFTVSNGVGAAVTTEAAVEAAGMMTAAAMAAVDEVPLDDTAVEIRRGWDAAAPAVAATPGPSGRLVVRSEEVSRVELGLGALPGRYSGYLRTAAGLAPLPAGSHLDASTGVFTWAPGAGFVGAYDLVFVRWVGEQAVARREVRVILAPKGSGAVGPQVVIETPRPQQDVAQPFVLGGWAADLDAVTGTGIATVHVWAYPLAGGPPVFLGAAAYGGARPNVAAVHGETFRDSGFGLVVQGLPHGHYDLAVFAWSTGRAGFLPARVIRLTVR